MNNARGLSPLIDSVAWLIHDGLVGLTAGSNKFSAPDVKPKVRRSVWRPPAPFR